MKSNRDQALHSVVQRTAKAWGLAPRLNGGIFAQAKKLVAAVVAAGVVTSAQAQGIPVLDVSNLAQALLMVQNLQQQVQTMAQQYQTMTTQLAALTGNRGLGQILNNPTLRSYLPDSWQGVYSQISSGQLPSITSAVQQIQSAEGMTATTPGQQRYNDTLAANKAMAMQAYQNTLARLQNIQSLMQQSDLTQDPAAKADLQNRWAAEYTMVQNEQTRLNLMAKLQDIEMKLAEEQRTQEFKNRLLGVSQ
ncbi:P-type DNA transfer protein VirB5 [Burkholderia ubonensis]|uniref:P-type DNA transfer protein VirB5 n=1 Tax=Burkholderia ubonensis TaxID=101571 RepID=UPI0009B32D02|nr:P-type DNA transfer protein VirB5 [Burkholderia ubonensis]